MRCMPLSQNINVVFKKLYQVPFESLTKLWLYRSITDYMKKFLYLIFSYNFGLIDFLFIIIVMIIFIIMYFSIVIGINKLIFMIYCHVNGQDHAHNVSPYPHHSVPCSLTWKIWFWFLGNNNNKKMYYFITKLTKLI